jgi:methylated-DNA-protein-cysteine methyltransferase-like protein
MPYDPARHGPRRVVGPGFHAAVHELVCTVPAGHVATYGDLAAALGNAQVARHVGFALANAPDDGSVPWWRIVAAGGRLARAGTAAAKRQAARLRREGVSVRGERVVDFAQRRWVPSTSR